MWVQSVIMLAKCPYLLSISIIYIINTPTKPTKLRVSVKPREEDRSAPPVFEEVMAATAAVTIAGVLLVDMLVEVVLVVDKVLLVVIAAEEVLVLLELLVVVLKAPIAMLVTFPVFEPFAFWYHGIPNASGTVLTVHPFEIIIGYSFMKTPTVLLLSSCSSMQRPGDFFPVSHPVIVASTPGMVYCGFDPIAQSPESERKVRRIRAI